MTLNDLPKETESAHALIRQKLNEHTAAIKEIMEEDRRQNEQLIRMDEKLDRVCKNTEGVLEVVVFSRKICKLIKMLGGVAAAISAVIALVHALNSGWFD